MASNVTRNPSLLRRQLTVDRNTSGDGAENATALHIDCDRTVAGSGTEVHNDIGIDLDVNAASLGASSIKGMDIDVVGATSGTSTAKGIELNVSGADKNHGLDITIPDGAADYHIRLFAADDTYKVPMMNTGREKLEKLSDVENATRNILNTFDAHKSKISPSSQE